MSDRLLNIVVVFLVMLMAAAAFAAGYFVRDLGPNSGGSGGSAELEGFELFWEAWERIDGNFLGDRPAPQQIVYGAIRGAIGALGDPYTIFIEPPEREQEREELRGNFGGIGATLTRNEAGELVLTPIPGNPAETAGILAGDVLLAVDGAPVNAEMTVQEIGDLIRGEVGTDVVLTVRHAGESDPVDISITRGTILIPTVSYALVPDDETIGYIRLSRFSGESAGEIETAINDLVAAGATSLILDLRGNGGGLLNAAIDIADHFLVGGPVMYQVSSGADEELFAANEETLAPEIPLVVLVDGGTASASEILAGALLDRGRATLIGPSQTFGKGSVQLVFDLSDGSSVHVTASRWFTPDRRPLDQIGLTPDILVTITEEAIQNGQDEVLARAVQLLQDGE